jgi:hypothetical protein
VPLPARSSPSSRRSRAKGKTTLVVVTHSAVVAALGPAPDPHAGRTNCYRWYTEPLGSDSRALLGFPFPLQSGSSSTHLRSHDH